MTQQSFGRTVKVRVYATIFSNDGNGNLGIAYNSGYTEFSSVQPDGSPGFRILGKINQIQGEIGLTTIKTNLSIYNLGPDSRALILNKVGTRFEILAGYGSSVKTIGSGSLILGKTHKAGADYITELVLGDGLTAHSNAFISQSFTGPTTYQQCIDACMAVLSGYALFPGDMDIPFGGFLNGQVLNGNPLDEIKRICRKLNLSVNVIGQLVYIIPIGASRKLPIIELSPDTGLIGIPELQPPSINGIPPVGLPTSTTLDISFKSLLNPELTIFQPVRIKSKFVEGDYSIITSVFDFDSWSGPFYTECQAHLLGGTAS